jgi:hypothetical protein
MATYLHPRSHSFALQHKPGILDQIKNAPTLAHAQGFLAELQTNYLRASSKTLNKAARLVATKEA